MPRRPAVTPLADRNAAVGGIGTLDRALSLLACFEPGAPHLTLAELARRTQIGKSTVLRMLASLAHANLVTREADGRYALGAEVERLHQVFTRSFALASIVMPALEILVAATRESAAFYVRHGEQRLCLYRVHSPRPVRDNMQPGDLLPMDQGAGGRVLLAFSGAPGELYENIRRDRMAVLVGDRVPELAGIGAPVFDAAGALVGAMTVTMPAERLDPTYEVPLRKAVQRVTTLLGGVYP